VRKPMGHHGKTAGTPEGPDPTQGAEGTDPAQGAPGTG